MKHRYLTSFMCCLLSFVMGFAQNRALRIESFSHDPFDQAAKEHPKKDGSGSLYALVKVRPANPDLKFSFGYMKCVVDTNPHDDEMWLYVQRNARMVTIKGTGFETIHDEDLKMTLQEGQTYVMKLEIEQPKKTTQTLVVKYAPQNAVVLIDGELVSGNKGIAQLELPFGTHQYNVVADGYVTQKGTIELTENNPGKLIIELDKKEVVAAITNPVKQPTNLTEQTFTVNGVSFTMIPVEAGTFTMGATSEQENPSDSEKPTHQVTLTKNYYIGQTEVTQALWKAVMGSNPSYCKGDNLPVEEVSWNDCQTFISKLNALTGKTFRLPTEAEWEFAARGGNKSQHTQYSGSATIKDVAWYNGNSSSTTHPVATKAPNELGIYDMSGNVWEWCQDWYGSYSSGAQTDPTGPTSGSFRVYRGGSWYNNVRSCRSARRSYVTPHRSSSAIGLRLVLSE